MADAESSVTYSSLDEFLNDLPKATLSRLYASPSSALALFRLLPPLARQLITHILFLDGPRPRSELEAWIAPTKEAQNAFALALKRLEALSILAPVSSDRKAIAMNDQFKHSLRRALTGGGSHRSFGVPCDTPDANAVSVEFLDNYARSKWEHILHFMVGSGGASGTTPREPVLALLRSSNLMHGGTARASTASALRITAKGFNFLLHDTNTQLWQLLLAYLSLTEKRNMDLVDVLAFLFMLGSLQLGRDYSTHELTDTQLQMLDDFRDYGLVYQRKSSSRRFYPTRLATTLTSDAPALQTTSRLHSDPDQVSGPSQSSGPPAAIEGAAEPRGFIILETNYRLYAYTSNPLRIAVLSLFASLRARYPNLIVGNLTRDSIKTALANGIGADQIIAYLQHHAHEQMYKHNPLLPVTVTDQIRLWEREKNRVTFEQGSLWTEFTSEADFVMVRDYAQSIEQLLWEDSENLRLFVSSEGHQPVRDYVNRRIQR
ncbi:RNA polymerase II transcription factor B 52 kDa subunit [Tilletia horrida]|uniref:RNA polymerase II transcription factor B subunit 2 n=1 Tax=Tilletia horrida TaxID=155126 RepID=A0AAN6GQ44_9BASI|nr:RNA polymerase II transcription factor B 52 kDa subunit [Tilletia horrida]